MRSQRATINARLKKLLGLILSSCVTLLLFPLWSEGATLASAVNNGQGGTFNLNPSTSYTGGVNISGTTTINCQGATITIGTSSNPPWIYVNGTALNINNCTIRNGSRALFYDHGASGTVSGSTIQNNTADGILIQNSSNPTITGNTIKTNTQTGINVASGANPYIANNTISGNGRGILVQSANATITGNSISGSTVAEGITLLSSSGGSITFNTITNNVVAAISAQNGSNPTVSNNTLASNYVGIYCQTDADPVITDNTIELNSGDGIFVDGCSPTVARNVVRNNQEAGINIFPNSSPVVSENNFSSNGFNGVEVRGDTSTITRNTISGNGKSGVFAEAPGGVPSQAAIDNNLIINNQESGVVIMDTSSPVFTANTIFNNGIDGFNLQNGAAPQIVRTIINGNDDHGVLVMSGAHPTITQSVIADNTNFAIFATGNSNPIAHQTSILCAVSGRGVYNQSNPTKWDATSNWWGSASGPDEDGPGTGCTAYNVLFNPFLSTPMVTALTQLNINTQTGSPFVINGLTSIGTKLTLVTSSNVSGGTVSIASLNLGGQINSPPPTQFIEVNYSDNLIRNLSSVQVIMQYNPAQLPAGANEANLRIFAQDLDTGQYIQLATTVDAVNNQVSATTTTSYNTFALMLQNSSPEVIAAQGPGGQNLVNTYNGTTGQLLDSFPSYPGGVGVSVAVGDLDGDGLADYVVGEGSGGQNRVTVYSGATGQALSTFVTFPGTSGITVAIGAVTGDGIPRIIVGQGPNGNNYYGVWALNGTWLRGGQAYGTGDGQGITVAAGDVNGDGIDDYVAGQGPGGSNIVTIYSGATGQVLAAFNTFPGTTGLTVAIGNVTGDGVKRVVAGQGPNGNNYYGVWALNGTWLRGGQAYGTGDGQGITVAAGDLNGDGIDDYVAGQGPGGSNIVTTYSGATGQILGAFNGGTGAAGVRVAIGNVVP